MNPINLDPLNEWWANANRSMRKADGTQEEWHASVSKIASLGMEYAGIAAAAVVSIAYDVRAIRKHLMVPPTTEKGADRG